MPLYHNLNQRCTNIKTLDTSHFRITYFVQHKPQHTLSHNHHVQRTKPYVPHTYTRTAIPANQISIAGLLGGLGDTLGKTVGGVTNTVGSTVGGLGSTVGDATSGLGQTVSGATEGVGNTTKGAGQGVQNGVSSLGGQKQTGDNPLGLNK